MYLLFVDESGRPDDRAFAVGGVAVRADDGACCEITGSPR